jgi:hypothetical protein
MFPWMCGPIIKIAVIRGPISAFKSIMAFEGLVFIGTGKNRVAIIIRSNESLSIKVKIAKKSKDKTQSFGAVSQFSHQIGQIVV